MVTGGSGTRVNLTRMLYRGDQAWSHRHDNPQGACRPFDADRDGGVVGEGAGALILESREYAEARGANILARVLGYGRSFESRVNHRGGCGDGIRRAINAALRSAEVTAADIGHVNAHGTSQIGPDRMEAQAIHDCLGDTPVTAPKSYFGCLGAGTGVVEMAASVLGIAEGEVPATLNYERPDPSCPVNVIRDEPLRPASSVALVLNGSETGQAVAVVIAAP
jgi:3-oxoacyl-[acyl-carrier-protein] synthase II